MKNFSKNILFIRELKGLKQVQISEKLDIKLSTWNNYEKGVSKPSIEGLMHISKFFGISETDLLHSDLEGEHTKGEFSLIEDKIIYKPKNKVGYAFSKDQEAFITDNTVRYNTSNELKQGKVVEALHEVIEMQKALIHSLHGVIEMLKAQLKTYKN